MPKVNGLKAKEQSNQEDEADNPGGARQKLYMVNESEDSLQGFVKTSKTEIKRYKILIRYGF